MTTQAVRAEDFVNSIGVNTHFDFAVTAYSNVSVVESALNYLGVKQVRDAMQFPTSPALFAQIAAATGVKYDLFLAPGAEADLPARAASLKQLPAGDIEMLEGRNEADLFGPGFQQGIADQVTLYQFAQTNFPGIPVIQESFAGLPDYGLAGDQSAFADFGNAHTYFGTGNNPALGDWIGVLNADALQATPGKPVIITETGYYTTGSTTDPHSVDPTVQAKYMLDIVLDSFQEGDAKTFLYELLDEVSGNGSSQDNFGLFLSDGTPKPAATAIRDLLTLLADPGSTAHQLPTGVDELQPLRPAEWRQQLFDGEERRELLAGDLGRRAAFRPGHADRYRRLAGPGHDQSRVHRQYQGFRSAHRHHRHPDRQWREQRHHQRAGSSGAGGDPSCQRQHDGAAGQSAARHLAGPSFTVPGAETVTTGQTIAVTGVQFNDAAAGKAAGTLSLNVSSLGGTFTITDGTGKVLTGTGTTPIFAQGTLAQFDAEFATLSYTAGAKAGRDELSITVTDQSGTSFGVAVQVAVAAPVARRRLRRRRPDHRSPRPARKPSRPARGFPSLACKSPTPTPPLILDNWH